MDGLRDMEVFAEFDDMRMLLQYLYMDAEHQISFNNGLTGLTIWMNEHCFVICRNDEYPDLPPTDFREVFTIDYCLALVDLLKREQAEFWNHLKMTVALHAGLHMHMCEGTI